VTTFQLSCFALYGWMRNRSLHRWRCARGSGLLRIFAALPAQRNRQQLEQQRAAPGRLITRWSRREIVVRAAMLRISALPVPSLMQMKSLAHQ
jgi:hypothetical protein